MLSEVDLLKGRNQTRKKYRSVICFVTDIVEPFDDTICFCFYSLENILLYFFTLYANLRFARVDKSAC